MANNDKGKTPSAKVQPGESFADAVREGTPADPNGDQNARLKPGETYADAVQEGLNNDNSNSETPPPYSAGAGGSSANGDSKSKSHTAASNGSGSKSNGKGMSLHLPNSHHVASPDPSPSGGQSHPHSHHFSSQHHSQREVDESMWPFGGPRARETEEGRIVMVPEREYVYALMRARRRFWATLFWALLIYLVAGAIVGGGVADANSHRGKHKGGDGRWHDNAIEDRKPFERAGVAPVDREVETPWDFAMEAVTE